MLAFHYNFMQVVLYTASPLGVSPAYTEDCHHRLDTNKFQRLASKSCSNFATKGNCVQFRSGPSPCRYSDRHKVCHRDKKTLCSDSIPPSPPPLAAVHRDREPGRVPANLRSGACAEFLNAVRQAPSGTRAFVFDIGANDGVWSRSWAPHLRPNVLGDGKQMELHIFEPQPVFHSRLTNLTRSQKMAGKATFIPAAAWTADGTTRMRFASVGSTSATIAQNGASSATAGGARSASRSDEAHEVTVRTVDAAAYINRVFVRWSSSISTANTSTDVPTATLPSSSSTTATATATLPSSSTSISTSTVTSTSTAAPPPLAILKLDVEGSEYTLLPWLLANNALCRMQYMLIEWHLNSLPPHARLAALGLRLSLHATLEAACVSPPVMIEHEEWPEANTQATKQGVGPILD